MRGLGAYIFLDQGICRLSVKAESVFERLHVGALLEEGFLQPVSTRMEILLWMNAEKTRMMWTVCIFYRVESSEQTQTAVIATFLCKLPCI